MRSPATTRSKSYHGENYRVDAVGTFRDNEMEDIVITFYDTKNNTEMDVTNFMYDHMDTWFINDMEQEVSEG
jgi:hypothetical protein